MRLPRACARRRASCQAAPTIGQVATEQDESADQQDARPRQSTAMTLVVSSVEAERWTIAGSLGALTLRW